MTWLSFKRSVSAGLPGNICTLFLYLSMTVATATATAQGISPAERLLFDTNHMQGIHAPTTLTYTYRKEAVNEAGFEDEVRLDVIRINPDATVAVTTRFLSGDRNVPLPAIDEAHGNPALLGFLERDIAEMKRLTGGSSAYFRKRIRMALAQAQEVRSVRFRYAGKEIQGQEVRIQPYLDDPMRDRFPDFEHKSYAFVFSQDLPGSLYRISSSSSQPAAKARPGIVETLTLVAAGQPGKQ